MKRVCILLLAVIVVFSSCNKHERKTGKVIAITTAETKDPNYKILFSETLFDDDVIVTLEVKGDAAGSPALDTIDALCVACRYDASKMPVLNTELTIIHPDEMYLVDN